MGVLQNGKSLIASQEALLNQLSDCGMLPVSWQRRQVLVNAQLEIATEDRFGAPASYSAESGFAAGRKPDAAS